MEQPAHGSCKNSRLGCRSQTKVTVVGAEAWFLPIGTACTFWYRAGPGFSADAGGHSVSDPESAVRNSLLTAQIAQLLGELLTAFDRSNAFHPAVNRLYATLLLTTRTEFEVVWNGLATP